MASKRWPFPGSAVSSEVIATQDKPPKSASELPGLITPNQDASQLGGMGALGTTSPDDRKPGRVLSEFEHLLGGHGCPACRYIDEAERSFFSWFEIESHGTVEVQSRLRAAMGMCPAHSRRLIEQIGEGQVLTIVAREALIGAQALLRGEGPHGPCPACEAAAFAGDRARHVIVDGLVDSAKARAYGEHGGLCLPHVLRAANATEPAALGIVAERLLASLREEAGPLVELLGGMDRDAPARARYRAQLEPEPAAASTVDRLSARLNVGSCPVCRSRGVSERDYVQWFVERARENDASLATDPGALCSPHLHDVARADRVAAGSAIERKRAATLSELERMLGRLAELHATAGRRRRAEAGELDRIRSEFTSTHFCPACHASDGIERSQLELVKTSLSLAPVRERYERGHGLCVRHAIALEGDPPGQLARRHAGARVGILAWEVRETARKYAWAYRHEPRGPERNAWLRALAQIDGQVFEGGAGAETEAADADRQS